MIGHEETCIPPFNTEVWLPPESHFGSSSVISVWMGDPNVTSIKLHFLQKHHFLLVYLFIIFYFLANNRTFQYTCI